MWFDCSLMPKLIYDEREKNSVLVHSNRQLTREQKTAPASNQKKKKKKKKLGDSVHARNSTSLHYLK